MCVRLGDAVWIKDAVMEGSKVAIMGHIQRRHAQQPRII
jgi:hypothetical protein